MPRERHAWPGEFDPEGGPNRGLEPDYGGVGTSPHYRGGSRVDQDDTTGSPGPYVGIGPKGYTRSDEKIHEDVCDRLMRFGYVDASDIEVSVQRGEVTLSGSVADRDQKRLAEDLADAVPGVNDVHNRIRIRRAPGVGTPELVREGRPRDEE